jgi:integrase
VKRLTLVIPVTRELADDPAALDRLKPPHPWFGEGPRGGLYEATGAVRRSISADYQDFFIRNMVAVEFESDGVRYLRPGSFRHQAAMEQLGGRKP